MAATIDPVTGLPLITTADLIDQIPLDAQVFPYADFQATQRPSRGPAYPDDVIPTSSIISGQNINTPQQPQTVYTDGNHHLLVKDVGSGGATAPTVSMSTANSGVVNSGIATGFPGFVVFGLTASTLWSTTVSIYILPGSIASHVGDTFYLLLSYHGSTGAPNMLILEAVHFPSYIPAAGQAVYNNTNIFNPGLDLSFFNNNGGFSFAAYCVNGVLGGDYSFMAS